jgi:hypothetical protein
MKNSSDIIGNLTCDLPACSAVPQPTARAPHGKAISITHSEYVSVALVAQNAKRMRRILLSSVVCLVVQYFNTMSPQRHDFHENVTERKMCVLFVSTSFVCSVSRFKQNSERYCHMCTYVYV